MSDVRDRCPMCGYVFENEEIERLPETPSTPREETARLKCPRCSELVRRDELIGEWDDCGWDL